MLRSYNLAQNGSIESENNDRSINVVKVLIFFPEMKQYSSNQNQNN